MDDVSNDVSDEVAEQRASARATQDHIARLVVKRDLLVTAAEAALDQAVCSIARCKWTPEEAAGWWEWARRLKIPHASSRVSKALGVPVNVLSQWRDNPPSVGTNRTGTWPVQYLSVPLKGVPCVYLLLDADEGCLYVGQSRHVRARLKSHQVKGVIPAVSWLVIECESYAAALLLEGDLIYQHQPIYNHTGRKSRRWVAADG